MYPKEPCFTKQEVQSGNSYHAILGIHSNIYKQVQDQLLVWMY